VKRFPPLTVAYITRRLRVNVATGRCFWKDPTKHHRPLVGKEAGCGRPNRSKNYWVIKLDGTPYRRSQIIYAVKTGSWPTFNLDHKNGNSLDDRACNLRKATFLENSRNRKLGYFGKILPMGVRQTNSKFQARIRVNKVGVHLGCFTTIKAASRAYRVARKQYFGDFA